MVDTYTRRDFVKAPGLGVTALTLPESTGVSQLLAGENKRPNIILIMADDLGYECLGCYGGTSYKTPALDELGLHENTLVLFTSDNGTPRGITSRMGHVVAEGGKGFTTDAGTHAPLIANWKGTIPAPKVCGDLVDFSDMLPTLAEAAGAGPAPNVVIDGRSFLPQLRGQKGNPRDWIFCYYRPNMKKGKWGLKVFARDKKYKLYRQGRLFNVQADPLEKNPIEPGQCGSEAAAARKRLQAVLDSMK